MDVAETSVKEESDLIKNDSSDENKRLFSSENFKIEVNNLPKFCGHAQMKKLFGHKLKLSYHKLKPCGPGKNYMFICFKNEEDKEKALTVINGFDYKGQKLEAKSASAGRDPLQRQKDLSERNPVVDDRPVAVRLQEAVCPLAADSYDLQLTKKQSEVSVLVKRLGSEVSRGHEALRQWVRARVREHETLAPVDNFVRSPVTNGYRNKCEFSIGQITTSEAWGSEKLVSVGFRLSSYKGGSVEVVSVASLEDPASTLPHVPARMIEIARRLELYIRASGVMPYCTVERRGHWRSVMMRTSRGGDLEAGAEDGEMMVVVSLDPGSLDHTTLDRIRGDLRQLFSDSGEVTSLFLHLSPARREAGHQDPAPELLSGTPTIQEVLLGRQFSISPQAFFQVNTRAAEILYKMAGDIANLNDKSTLVDVCCGTGTIGLCLADKVRNVVGVDIVADAIRDAQKNAELNSVTNCAYFTGKAEDILQTILRDIDNKDIVAIVDPPRAGLHQKALRAIRSTLAIRRLVYISCDAKNAMKNFVDLSRPPSKTALGDPFLPVKIIPVDLFPHSKGFELVILFERIPWGDILNSEIDKRLKEVEAENLDDMVNIADKLKKEREVVKEEVVDK